MAVEESLHKWQDKLLDLGRGNPLINFRASKSRTVEILNQDHDDVFLRLSNEERIPFFDTDEYFKGGDFEEDEDDDEEEIAVDADIQATLDKLFEEKKNKKQTPLDHLIENYKKKDILAYKPDGGLKRTLRGIKRLADSSLTERGINILYVAFGFITWADKNSPKDKDIYRSPLLLIPASLINDNKTLPFYLEQYEDDVTTNPSLAYKFKNDFNIDLPEYDPTSNESLTQYLFRVREEMRSHSFECVVESGAQIGLFSFLKISMYEDIKDNWDKVVRNKAVRKILGNEDVGEHYEPIDYDAYFKEGKEVDLHNVVDADSSQLKTIIAAKSGRDLVLQGPPGTGKSQTITNLIAEYLADGKKVLFVSEKLAALEVVYNNLKKAGIADFCLELHSNKANKKDVIDELYTSLENGPQNIKSSALDELNSLKMNKEDLDEYAAKMHTPISPINKTPYEINGLVYEYSSFPTFNYAFPEIKTLGKSFYSNAIDSISFFVDLSEHVGYKFWENPWYGFTSSKYSYDVENSLKDSISNGYLYVCKVNTHLINFNKCSPLELHSENDVKNNREVLDFLSSVGPYFRGLFDNERANRYIEYLDKYLESSREIAKRKNRVSKVFNSNIYQIDYDLYISKFNRYRKNVFLRLGNLYRSDCEYINKYKINSRKKLSPKKILKLLDDVKFVCIESPNFDKTQTDIFHALNLYDDVSDKAVTDIRDQCARTVRTYTVKHYDLSLFANFDYSDFKNFQTECKSFFEWYDDQASLARSLDDLQSYFDIKVFDIKDTDYNKLAIHLNSLNVNFSSLYDWTRFTPALDKLNENNVFDFVVAGISQGIKKDDLVNSFSAMFYIQWQKYIYSNDVVLLSFNRLTQDRKVKTFRDKDKLRFEISKAQIYDKLTRNYPSLSDASIPGTEANTLSKEHMKQRKLRPVRLLLKDCGHLIQSLKPCFLMSPLSVSTYLTYDTCHFDVVIFDEASQIFPWDAVGAIYRAKQVIVVGDSKQMPPSNYFNAELEDNEDEEDFDDSSLDFESILDICSSTFERERLNWHYRSRTEDLISFSNQNFYDNSLVTFPSVHKNTKDLGIDYYYIENGTFDRKSKTNEKEAEKVVDLVFEHFKTHPDRSLGVVAFNIKQQEEIEDAINRRRDKDERFEKYFSSNQKEPFFVKNLETVQGDERDTIIFSVAYARDREGKFYLNFGPLNRNGGERRLNVAVTRAKLNVKLVTSIRSSDFDLSRTESVGVRLLRDYLKYAENGGRATLNNITGNTNNVVSFEDEIADFLTSKGINFDRNVGCSSYRIDIAVKDPRNNDYVLAIECDGDTYASAETTRDRDRLRQEVLEKLGWRFYRIWSSEWILKTSAEQQRLLQAIQDAISSYNNGGHEEAGTNSGSSSQRPLPDDSDEKKNSTSLFVEKSKTSHDLKSFFPVYPTHVSYPTIFNTYDYYGYDSSPIDVSDELLLVVQNEQPITEELLLKRCTTICNRSVASSFVKNSFNFSVRHTKDFRKIGDYYTTEKSIKLYRFRVPATESDVRDISYISIYELAGGMVTIVEHLPGITKEGIYDALLHLMGVTRMGSKIKDKFDRAYKMLCNSDVFIIDDEGKHTLKALEELE